MERIKTNTIIGVSITNPTIAIKFDSVEQASHFFVSRCASEVQAIYIQDCLDGNRENFLGYTWHYAEDRERMTRYNSERIQCVGKTGTEEFHGIIFDSLAQAQAVTGIPSPNICDCCRGKRKTAGGYQWNYVDKFAD